jgi:hypothetical protein
MPAGGLSAGSTAANQENLTQSAVLGPFMGHFDPLGSFFRYFWEW